MISASMPLTLPATGWFHRQEVCTSLWRNGFCMFSGLPFSRGFPGVSCWWNFQRGVIKMVERIWPNPIGTSLPFSSNVPSLPWMALSPWVTHRQALPNSKGQLLRHKRHLPSSLGTSSRGCHRRSGAWCLGGRQLPSRSHTVWEYAKKQGLCFKAWCHDGWCLCCADDPLLQPKAPLLLTHISNHFQVWPSAVLLPHTPSTKRRDIHQWSERRVWPRWGDSASRAASLLGKIVPLCGTIGWST